MAGERPSNFSNLSKLRRMLRLTARHRATYALLLGLLTWQLSKAIARFLRKQRARERFMAQLLEHSEESPPIRVQSAANLVGYGERAAALNSPKTCHSTALEMRQHTGSFASLDRLQVSQVTRPGGEARELLSDLLSRDRHSGRHAALCEPCFSRCSSHNSLSALAPSEAAPSECEPCDDGSEVGCVVCEAEDASWRLVVRHLLLASSGSVALYCLWLRFCASKETVLRHATFVFEGVGRLFAYKVDNLDALPAGRPALVYCYHGFVPLDMYFFHAALYRSHTPSINHAISGVSKICCPTLPLAIAYLLQDRFPHFPLAIACPLLAP